MVKVLFIIYRENQEDNLIFSEYILLQFGKRSQFESISKPNESNIKKE